MKAVYKEPGRAPEIIDVENDLATLQKLVGGYIETVAIASDACVICNEEGRLLGLPHNISPISGVDFVGPILIVGTSGDAFCDVPMPEFWLSMIQWVKKRDLSQLDKLEKYLKENHIPFERIDKDDKAIDDEHPYCLVQMEQHQICVPSAEERDWDAICQRGSYGAEHGLLEIMGSIVKGASEVEGWLTAEDVIHRIEEKEVTS